MIIYNPFVSIIIPVYNGQEFMQEAIDSALNQTYKHIEVVVVNDGSTDRTDKIALSYDNKIRYFRKNNGGVADALNFAIKKAKGKYISWLSHDDIYTRDKISEQIDTLNTIPKNLHNKTILFSDFMLIDSKGIVKQEVSLQKLFSKDKLTHPLFALFRQVIHGCSLLIPKQSLSINGLFDIRLKHTQDYYFWFKIFPTHNLVHVPKILVKSRQHDAQSSKTDIDAIVEGDQLWLKMYKGITDKEKEIIGGNLESFYLYSFRNMILAKHFKAAQYLVNGCKKQFPSAYKTCMDELRKYLQIEQSAREFEVMKNSKIFKLWKGYDSLKKAIKNKSKKI